MIRTVFNKFRLSQKGYNFSSVSEGASFLKMV